MCESDQARRSMRLVAAKAAPTVLALRCAGRGLNRSVKDRTKAINDFTKHIGRDLGIVGGRVRGFFIPLKPGNLYRA